MTVQLTDSPNWGHADWTIPLTRLKRRGGRSAQELIWTKGRVVPRFWAAAGDFLGWLYRNYWWQFCFFPFMNQPEQKWLLRLTLTFFWKVAQAHSQFSFPPGVCFSVLNLNSLGSAWTHAGGVTFVLGYYGSSEPQRVSLWMLWVCPMQLVLRVAGWRSRKCCKIWCWFGERSPQAEDVSPSLGSQNSVSVGHNNQTHVI